MIAIAALSVAAPTALRTCVSEYLDEMWVCAGQEGGTEGIDAVAGAVW